ncbi:MAG: zinc ABC transporter substrate-binding protein [bacterium]|nr:MAG: zinc ABC transporter substrate-binding protein [bacterium]
MKFIYIINFIVCASVMLLPAQDKINVVTTLTLYADLANYIGGDKVETHAIVAGNQDAHFVQPKPSFAVWMNKADLFVETGLDLEIWAPALIDKSRNPRIRSGQSGYVAVADGVQMLQVPASPDRSQGDVHIYGNPHIFTSPVNARIIAENITIGLSKVSPENADYFKENLSRFKNEIDGRLFGEELVNILGGEALVQLANQGRLISFLKSQTFQDQELLNLLGGWMKEMLPYRGRKLVAYHQNWVYFEKLFGLEFIGYIEPKPGIPPSPKHVEKVIQAMRQQDARVILSANYFDERKVREIAEKIGGIAVIVPLSVTDQPETGTYFELVDYWIQQLITAFNS